ncbi:GGDEF domain-containing protein [Salinimonas iocasae]|uniref:diguanylate cyclase n=1 Tax=Salinimonas iocasae TaxID=2572577 RepID=A0A5B7YCF4_9ALTE|nr:GGDEF domain-containing protein [Salinimonas iocasae]QCZ93377.1 GGDEF domain-containing protein [Salinimonas iocasae]
MRIFLLLIFLSIAISAYADTSAMLEEADSLRLADPKKAKQILDDLDRESLSAEEQYTYDYITIYLSTILEQNLGKTVKRYEAFIKRIPDSPTKVRAMTSLLALSAYKGHWRRSFTLVSELTSLMNRIDAYEVEPDAYNGLLLFYNEVEQPDMAISYAQKIFSHPAATSYHQCIALTEQASNLAISEPAEVSEDDFYDAIELCSAVPLTYYVALNYNNLLNFLIDKQAYTEASLIISEATERIEIIDFKYLTASLLLIKAKLKVAADEPELAKQYALQVLEADVDKEYRESLITAYSILANIAAEQQQYQQAYEYEKKHRELSVSLYNQKVSKSLAIQEARFDLQAKESQIDLLDKKNQLLTTESKLVKEQISSMLLVIGLALLLVIMLLFWSYRNRKIQKRLHYLASTDHLTGISNRGNFSEKSKTILQSAGKSESSVALIFIDLDHFKSINDAYGHQVGDWVLIQVVNSLNTIISGRGMQIGRIGGEEFGIILPDTGSIAAKDFAEHCREIIQKIDTFDTGSHFQVTASFGIADTDSAGYNLDNLFSAADLALYQSKKYGRNRVSCYEGDNIDL